jgi:hypothetical protein
LNSDYIEDATLTGLHKLLDDGNKITIEPFNDQFAVVVKPLGGSRSYFGVGNDIQEALADSRALQDELVEEGSA